MAEKVKLVPAFGVVLASLGLFLLLRKKKPPLPEPPENGIVVGLINPPIEATMWTLTLTDWNMTVLIDFVGRNGIKRLDTAEAAIFEIPDGLEFPLRVALLQLTKWNPEGTALIQLYSAQSIRELDPDYREVFIPNYGSFYYNVSKERFE